MEIRYTAEFKRNLRHLAKRYRRIRSDIDPVLAELQAGRIVGAQIPGIGETLFKVRVRNSDAQRGKRGGYRLIYYLAQRDRIILVTIYSKSVQGDVTAVQIRRILAEE
ncbi:MAG: addiction module antitoxin [Candidatus Muproteobacteria bacterium RBG_16_65_34]|uniref:Addiction module antitoxin n=1 Tax=Candidatus Muproteobacteria bacterium RBG_16_65_34 TaxID=1817760 RepID=A0A1F6TT28_9PROT|nr:MAG: addiction module antitoxin [Candidatus Muproteobacteria bacterium RBG_16_65_34]